ncbi:bifunctional DNA primase/polymerase [bacterium]|nr:bifunctional DNA primase/polymerase [bacterium]
MSRKIAREYKESGLNPVPLKQGGKIPIRNDWGSPINDDIENYAFEEIGICTGAVSGGLEGIDFDLKYADNPKELWDDWRLRVPKDILTKLVVCKTVNNGYHALYRTTVAEGNRKLAKNERKEVLIETRGEGGYLKCYPSEGYEVIYGDLTKINTISDTERAILMSTSMLFDKSISKTKKFYSDDKEYKDPFPKYNQDPDIGIDLLLKHGWTIERESDLWVELTRPGKTEGVSAGYKLEGCFLFSFTTSTEFETEQPYSNSAIFCMLEAGGNYKVGYGKLASMGYGEQSGKDEIPKEDDEDGDLNSLSFISKEGEDEERLFQAIDGTIPLGLSYGWKTLDEYVLFKENSLNFILAFEGVGKTYVELHKLMALSVLYGKKFAVACGENEVSSVKRILIEALSGKDVSNFKGNMSEFKRYKDFVNSHFFIFKNDFHYSVEDVLKRGEVLHKMYKIDGLFIDPFSYFKRPLTNVYSYNDDLLSKLNIYSKTVCAVFMSVHPTTDATRAPRDAEGYLNAPTQYDAIGGNIFANRCDHFLVYHRIRNHKIPQMRRIMEIRQYKVKDEQTGGKVTPINESVTITLKEVDGFTGYFDKSGDNPMYNAYKKSQNKELPRQQPTPDIF